MNFSQAEALRLGFARLGAKQEERNYLFPLFKKDIEEMERQTREKEDYYEQTLKTEIDHIQNEVMPLFRAAKERGDYFQNEFETALRDRDEYTENLLERQGKQYDEQMQRSLSKVVGAANGNTLYNAQARNKGSPWAVLSKETGLLSVFPNYEAVILDLEKSEPYDKLIKVLVDESEQQKFEDGDKSLYEDNYLDNIFKPKSTRKNNFDKIFDRFNEEDGRYFMEGEDKSGAQGRGEHKSRVMRMPIEGTNQALKAIIIGEGDNARALFRIKE